MQLNFWSISLLYPCLFNLICLLIHYLALPAFMKIMINMTKAKNNFFKQPLYFFLEYAIHILNNFRDILKIFISLSTFVEELFIQWIFIEYQVKLKILETDKVKQTLTEFFGERKGLLIATNMHFRTITVEDYCFAKK